MESDQSEDAQDAAALDNAHNPVPNLKPGAHLVAAYGRLLSKKTSPPTRYSEATLIKELERLGIGRPSTYAAILDTILTRDYVRIEKQPGPHLNRRNCYRGSQVSLLLHRLWLHEASRRRP